MTKPPADSPDAGRTKAALGPSAGNIFSQLSNNRSEEEFLALLSSRHLRIERIVSTGQETPPGEWLQQDRAEWVILLRGAARLLFEGEGEPRLLGPGDYVNIPALCRHRVEWTATEEPTVWLAVHYDG
jgi:cupin 2 domain-containing protein